MRKELQKKNQHDIKNGEQEDQQERDVEEKGEKGMKGETGLDRYLKGFPLRNQHQEQLQYSMR